MNKKCLDEEIKKVFQDSARELGCMENRFLEIEAEIQKREEKNMKKLFSSRKMKAMVITAAICVVSISCYAGAKISSSEGHTQKIYSELPSKQEVKKQTGFTPNYVEKFSNGYTFRDGGPGETTQNDEDGNVVNKCKTIAFTYENKEKSSLCSLLVEPVNEYNQAIKGDKLTIDGLSATWTHDRYKFVGTDADVTAEDKALEAKGELYISYGGEGFEPEYNEIVGLYWQQDGLNYCLMNSDSNLNQDEMIAMAKEIINQ